jgi:raffinose/stachyose/melibiose transport system permease protein
VGTIVTGREGTSAGVTRRTGRPRKSQPLVQFGYGLTYLILVLFTLVVAFPLIALFLGSFKGQYDFYANPWGWPAAFHLDNYVYAWTSAQIPRFFVNSVIVTAATVALTLVLASCAAYGFSTFHFRGSRVLFFMFVLLLIIPVPITIIPLYVIVVRLHLIDTYFALILPYTAGSLPLSIILLRAFFESIPHELADAARVDGCTHRSAFVRVILPVAKPGLATVTILAFINAWNEFFLGLIFIRNQDLMTLPLGLQSFFYQYRTDWTHLFAALTMTIVPIIVVYVAMQRQFIAGLTAGATRG